MVDDQDHPIAACAAKRILELYFYYGIARPHVILHAIRVLHYALEQILRSRGYNCAEACIPPEKAKRFGKRLEKTFGWWPGLNWPRWYRGF